MNHATCFRLLSATHFATSLLPLTVRLISVLTEIGRLIVGFRRAEQTPQVWAWFKSWVFQVTSTDRPHASTVEVLSVVGPMAGSGTLVAVKAQYV